MSDEMTGTGEGTPENTALTGQDGGQEPMESFINADGTLKEGWQDHYIPEDFRGRPCYKAIGNDIKDIMRHIGNQDIAISRQGKGVFIPGEDASESEVREFHRQMGVPDSPEKYEFVPPKELEQFYEDTETLDEVKRTLHKAGITPSQFKTIMELDALRLKQSDDMLKGDPLPLYNEILPLAQEKLAEQAEKELKQRWGDQYDSRLQLANLAIAENVQDDNEKQQLLERIGNDPLIADFLATVQLRHHTEAKGVDTSVGSGVDKRSVDQRIDELNGQLTIELKQNNRQKYDALLQERSKLYSVRYPEPQVG